MPRQINLRQVEAFKAVIEHGTVSRAAQILHVSQPAMSKLIANLEFDSGLKLFDRFKGRLAPTENGMRLYREIDRIFAGVRAIDSAVEAIRREDQGRISIGVLPALAGQFIQRATMRLQAERPDVFCAIQSRNSWDIVDWVAARKFDVGLVDDGFRNPYVVLEPILDHAMVCILPRRHPLARKRVIEPKDLDRVPFVGFPPDSQIGLRLATLFESHGAKPRTVVTANFMLTVGEFVAAGAGASVVHPLLLGDFRSRVEIRRFVPAVHDRVSLCRCADSRNANLIDAFVRALRATAEEAADEIPPRPSLRRRRPA